MLFDESKLIRVASDFTISLQAVLAIGTYIVTYGAGEKLKVVANGVVFLTYGVIASGEI